MALPITPDLVDPTARFRLPGYRVGTAPDPLAGGAGADDWFGQQGPPGGPPAGAPVSSYEGMAGQMDPGFGFRLGLGGEWQTDPGYQFRLQQGQQALERSAAARGTLLTGGTAKALTRYGQGVASDEYQRRYQRLLGEQQNRYTQLYGLSQLGANAAAGQATQNQGFATGAGDLMTQIGNAQAAGTVGGANAWQQGIGNAANIAQMYYLARLYGQQPPGAMYGPPSGPGVAVTPYT